MKVGQSVFVPGRDGSDLHACFPKGTKWQTRAEESGGVKGTRAWRVE